MQIGSVKINGYAALAPMAGVADRAFRRICVEFGAAYVVGEMVSSKGIVYGDKKSEELLVLDDHERPAAVQLFGDNPDIMARAAEHALKFNPDVIDINMGCPVPKVAGNNCGSALMRDPELCRRIVFAVVSAVNVPVTAKIRKGYSAKSVNAVEVALACEAGGAAAIAVHGRTREQMYSPPVDWDIIRKVKQAVKIPVIGNGDVTSALKAADMYRQTGCDLVMVGRGALGAPWIFAQINAYLEEGKLLPDPPIEKRMEILLRQISLAARIKGERRALLEARKHSAWAMRGLPGAASFRAEAGRITTLDELKALCEKVCEISSQKE